MFMYVCVCISREAVEEEEEEEVMQDLNRVPVICLEFRGGRFFTLRLVWPFSSCKASPTDLDMTRAGLRRTEWYERRSAVTTTTTTSRRRR